MSSTPITSLEAVLDSACAKFCGECGEPLAPPGSQCGECGTLPSETRQEASERLAAEPDPVAAAEAARLRREAVQHLAAAERAFRAADDAEYRSRLKCERDAAQARFEEALSTDEDLAAVLAGARKAEEETGAPLADARGVHARAVRDEETARRLRKGAGAETDAMVRVQAAAGVLARYEAEAAAASRAREAAEAAARRAGQAVAGRERERDAAQLLLDRHATVPLSGVTVMMLFSPLARMALGRDIDGRVLDDTERGMVGTLGQALHSSAFAEYAGALDQAEENRLRARIREEEAARPRLRTVGDGQVAWLNTPKLPGPVPPGGVVTPAPRLSQPSPFTGAPGFVPGLPQ